MNKTKRLSQLEIQAVTGFKLKHVGKAQHSGVEKQTYFKKPPVIKASIKTHQAVLKPCELNALNSA